MAFYLFPSLMYHRYKRMLAVAPYQYGDEAREELSLSLKNSYKIYNLCIKQYLGFGAFLQFIPGTNAAKARKQLTNELEPKLSKLKELFKLEPSAAFVKEQFPNTYFARRFIRASLTSYYNFDASISNFLFESALAFKHPMISYTRNLHLPFLKIMNSTPILKYCIHPFKDKWLSPWKIIQVIILNLLNPFHLAIDTLRFVHALINRVIEIGTWPGSSSSVPRLLLKGLVGFVFGLVQLPLQVLQFPFEVLNIFVFSPMLKLASHLGKSVQNAYRDGRENKAVIIETAEAFRDMKELRQAAKDKDASYSIIGKQTGYSAEYIGTTKEKLYTDEEGERLVAIRSSRKKIASTTSLLSITSLFSKEGTKAKENELAIHEAKNVLGLN
ncbi:hypothetical protein [Legionella cardiaca]|uniref:Uncharacterized protein n=1 Tax=Legionella cardiaca TaxID=1071983 RepID=A0ABY8AS56_9GAMM|nr:hypothetical protein [Legionella cardiaca]WED42126.1 hypothetical protein PXX05_09315 [Legionella cardiaca]